MDRIMVINSSPRAPVSNSLKYSQIFLKYAGARRQYFRLNRKNHRRLAEKTRDFDHILLVFPLYADGIPVTLLNFLKIWEENLPCPRPSVSVMANCGFLEPRQNDTAVDMVRLFCEKNGLPFASSLKIGGGEAILSTPFSFMARRRIKKLCRAILRQKPARIQVTMPLSPRLFAKAADSYWTAYGQKYGTSKEQMRTMDIEKQS